MLCSALSACASLAHEMKVVAQQSCSVCSSSRPNTSSLCCLSCNHQRDMIRAKTREIMC